MENIHRKEKKKKRQIMGAILLLFFATLLFSCVVGRYHITIEDLLTIFANGFDLSSDLVLQKKAIVFSIIRIPRILMCIIVGACISVSGACYQGLFKNPMVSPDILGVSSAAGVGASIGILLSWDNGMIQLIAFLFGIGAVLLVMMISKVIDNKTNNLVVTILAGTVIGSIFASLNGLIKYVADAETKLPEITFWLMGSFSHSSNYRNVLIIFFIFVVCFIPIYMIRWQINIMLFGSEEAQSMGINTKKIKQIIIICSTLMIAACVSFCGVIGWVGLIIPHMIRLILGSDYRYIIPGSVFFGASFMLIVDTICRSMTSSEIPLGILTSLVGAPIFIYLLIKGRRYVLR